MKLQYYRDSLGNVGDDLNPWLWPRLLPGFFDGRDDVIFIGIGTILGPLLPASPRKVVFGSGAGYGDPPILDKRWDVRFVRGPRTAAALRLPRERAITDSALAVRFVIPAASGGRGIAFMPHHLTAEYANWPSICHAAGISFIDPRDSVTKVMGAIAGCALLISEAMHGAILADALRVPWHAVKCGSHINEFKWNDWCDSLELPYEPTKLPAVFDGTWARFPYRQRLWLRQAWRAKSPRIDIRPIPMTRTPPAVRDELVSSLEKIAAAGGGMLSTDPVCDRAIARIHDELELLRRMPVIN